MLILVSQTQYNRQIDSHEFASGVFLDFSKAFDTADHNLLIEKLDNYGIRGVPKYCYFFSSLKQAPVCILGTY